jgi:hypothetical protein
VWHRNIIVAKSAWAHARESLRGMNLPNEANDDAASVVTNTENVIDLTKRHPLTGSLNFSEKLKLMSLLEQWEEPIRRQEGNVRSYWWNCDPRNEHS